MDQASRHLVDLDRTSINVAEDEDGPHPEHRRKYALMQRLPNGDWWTSASHASRGLTRKEAAELVKGQAELVAILPSAHSAPEDQPKLGDYLLAKKEKSSSKSKTTNLQLTPRKLASGTFLDYGPYMSFAPSFDSDAAEVGREALGEIYHARTIKREIRKQYFKSLHRAVSQTLDSDVMQIDGHESTSNTDTLEAQIAEFFSENDAPGLKAFVEDMQLEEQVSELLKRNSTALENLCELQMLRLNKGGTVEEGSEEWELGKL